MLWQWSMDLSVHTGRDALEMVTVAMRWLKCEVLGRSQGSTTQLLAFFALDTIPFGPKRVMWDKQPDRVGEK